MAHTAKFGCEIQIPNLERLELYRRAPEFGPKILFFTGGTALRSLSETIVQYTHNSIHIVTPFDSGGSSAAIRKAFRMPAVGDLRNRIMALADKSVKGNPLLCELFSYRLPKTASREELFDELRQILDGSAPLVRRVSNPIREAIGAYLSMFFENMPKDFDLRGACIGNLIMAGGFLAYNRNMDPVLDAFSGLVEARGEVCAVTYEDLHLVSELEDGSVLVGQHLITGKGLPSISSPVKRVYITDQRDDPLEIEVGIYDKVKVRIVNADLICYPIGSFYSSVVANFLVKGVGDAIGAVMVPKVYIPNAGNDPEQFGMGLLRSVETLIHYLRRSCTEARKIQDVLNFVLMDPEHPYANAHEEIRALEKIGIQVMRVNLVTSATRPYYCAQRMAEYLLSLA